MSQSTNGGYPVDNNTYNLMQALVSKLEAIEVYRKYQRDGNQELFAELIREDSAHAERLVAALKQALR
jgi:hypothetical protein